jgi:hypothetical protein
MPRVSDQTFRRRCRRFEVEGEAPSGPSVRQRVPADAEAEVDRLYRTLYRGFAARHVHEHPVGLRLDEAVPAIQRSAGEGAEAGRASAQRPRHPLPGMMLHQDGSRHGWLKGQPAMVLIE